VLFAGFSGARLGLGRLIGSIEMFAMNPGVYAREYEKLHRADYIGMREEDLGKVTQKLLDYTAGKADSLDMQAEINGEMREVFDGREKAHMADVRALYLCARGVRTGALIGAAVFAIAAFALGGKRTLKTCCKSFLWVSLGYLAAVGAIAAFAAADFDAFWTNFHYVFFPGNDLWQLYDYEVLIQMVPGEFFAALVARIIIRFISIFLTLNIAAAAGLLLIRKKERRRKAETQGA
jgi:integral membrane protein (TIGR01906 family)